MNGKPNGAGADPNLDFSTFQAVSQQAQQQNQQQPISATAETDPNLDFSTFQPVQQQTQQQQAQPQAQQQDMLTGAFEAAQKAFTPPQHVSQNEFSTLLQSGMATLHQALSSGLEGMQKWVQDNPSVAQHLTNALGVIRQIPRQMASAEQQRLLAGQVEEARGAQAPEPTRSDQAPQELEMAPEPETPESASAGADMPEDPAAAATAPAKASAEKSAYQSPYGNLVEQAAATHGVDAGLINAMMAQESGGKPEAISKKGASGLMQLMPGTARDLGLKTAADIRDPAKNIEAGVRYFKQQLDRYDGDVRKALAAYNAGPGSVPRHGALVLSKLPNETQNYVKSIMKKWGGDQEEITARE